MISNVLEGVWWCFAVVLASNSLMTRNIESSHNKLKTVESQGNKKMCTIHLLSLGVWYPLKGSFFFFVFCSLSIGVFAFAVLGFETMALHLLRKWSISDIYPQSGPYIFFLFIHVFIFEIII